MTICRNRLSLVAAALVVATTSAFAGRITLYEGQDYQGHYITTNDSVAIVGSPAFAYAAASVVVTDGVWEACTDAYFRGRCMRLSPGEYPRINGSLNGGIASLRQVEMASPAPVVISPAPAVISPPTAVIVSPQPLLTSPPQGLAAAPPSTGRIVLYEHPNFGGGWAVVERGPAKDLDWANFSYGHRATSIRVESGTWLFCSEMAFRGECRTFGPGEYPQLSGPLIGGVASARQVSRPEYGSFNLNTR